MTRNQMDAVIAARLGCTATYVQHVRCNPGKYKSRLAEQIKRELASIEQKYQTFKRSILQVT